MSRNRPAPGAMRGRMPISGPRRPARARGRRDSAPRTEGEGWGGRSGPGGAANVPEKRFCGRCWIQWRRRTSIAPANGCERCDWSAACWQATLIGSFRMKAPQPQSYLSHVRPTPSFLSIFGAGEKNKKKGRQRISVLAFHPCC